MPDARDRIAVLLVEYVPGPHIDALADSLMRIVRDSVAEGFEAAALLLERPIPDGATPAELLHELARQLWAANKPDASQGA